MEVIAGPRLSLLSPFVFTDMMSRQVLRCFPTSAPGTMFMFTSEVPNNAPALNDCRKNVVPVDVKRMSTDHTLRRAAVEVKHGFRFMTFRTTADRLTSIAGSNIPTANWHLKPPRTAEEMWPVHCCEPLKTEWISELWLWRYTGKRQWTDHCLRLCKIRTFNRCTEQTVLAVIRT